jgi:hypothetical protein
MTGAGPHKVHPLFAGICKTRAGSRGSGDGVGLGVLLRRTVSPPGGQAAELGCAAAWISKIRSPIIQPFRAERVAQQVGQQVHLAVAGEFGFVAVDGREQAPSARRGPESARQSAAALRCRRRAEIPAGEARSASRARRQRRSCSSSLRGRSRRGSRAPVRLGLLRLPSAAVPRSTLRREARRSGPAGRIVDPPRVDHLAQATDNAGHRVREGSIEVEDEGWQWGVILSVSQSSRGRAKNTTCEARNSLLREELTRFPRPA